MLRRHQCATVELQQNGTMLHFSILVGHRETDLVGIGIVCSLHTLQHSGRYLSCIAAVKLDRCYFF